jgi:fibronectin-binding autotransporter adhesin
VKLAAPTAVLATSRTGTVTVSNVISGTGFFEENGGTTILTNTESYSGPTIIDFGTLEVNGSIAAGSAVSVASDGALTGKGTIHGSATLTGSGIIDFSPGGGIAGTLGVTAGNWNGVGIANGLITSSSGTFTIGGTLTAPAGLAVTGGTIAGSGTLAGGLNYTSNSNATFGFIEWARVASSIRRECSKTRVIASSQPKGL